MTLFHRNFRINNYQDNFVVDERQVYVYAKDANLKQSAHQLPMILDLNCTSGNARAEAMTNGWQDLAKKEDIIVVAPEYDDYVTYSEVPYFIKVIEAAEDRYNIDQNRIYSVGFSNGGASSMALASTYPNLLAGLAGMGWLIRYARSKDVQLPFVLIQGTREYIDQLSDGSKAVNEDERQALHDLFTGNQMLAGHKPDYQKYPYWGYPADRVYTKELSYNDYDWYGHHEQNMTNKLHFYDFRRNDFTHPYARLVLVPNSPHRPHSCNAAISWDLLKHFRRNKDKIEEIN